jgi:uncharacterized protein
MNNDIFVSQDQVVVEQQRFMVKVYGWMAAALAITGLVALYTASSPALTSFIFANKGVVLGLFIVQLLLVGSMVGFINRMSASVAGLIFILYSVLTGFVFSGLFFIYTAGSIASTFFITGGIFAVMSAYGYFTGNDLTRFGSLLFMALIGLVIASLVNIFLHSEALYWITTYAGVFIFIGLIAYDTQKLKDMSGAIAYNGGEAGRKLAIYGALSLYLDFINLFIMLLRIFGRRR